MEKDCKKTLIDKLEALREDFDNALQGNYDDREEIISDFEDLIERIKKHR